MSLLLLLALACVPKKDYDALQAEMNALRVDQSSQLEERDARITTLGEALAAEQGRATGLEDEIARLKAELEAANTEKAQLVSDRSRLRSSVAEMEQALNELAERKRAADRRIEQYQDLLSRFQKLIDSGRLQVRIVDGRMVVALATDILFASGSAELSEEGAVAIKEVAQVLAEIPDRAYQVEGHTDNVAIKTAQYPSNWELASARATVVVKEMIAAGLDGERLSAASFSKYRPVAANDSREGRAQNRRIEIVVIPDLSELPGFEELNALAQP